MPGGGDDLAVRAVDGDFDLVMGGYVPAAVDVPRAEEESGEADVGGDHSLHQGHGSEWRGVAHGGEVVDTGVDARP